MFYDFLVEARLYLLDLELFTVTFNNSFLGTFFDDLAAYLEVTFKKLFLNPLGPLRGFFYYWQL